MTAKNKVRAMDLFVTLERAFRSRTRNCKTCTFSLPYRVDTGNTGSWAVIPAATCSESCRLLLEEVISQHQEMYTLAES